MYDAHLQRTLVGEKAKPLIFARKKESLSEGETYLKLKCEDKSIFKTIRKRKLDYLSHLKKIYTSGISFFGMDYRWPSSAIHIMHCLG